ncbi:MAG: nucleotide exchange factor GrpE [Bacteroidales bacterium]|nr:nucleotide exchange factor GrpE [Candidatus Sodaliphilus limicaballi]
MAKKNIKSKKDIQDIKSKQAQAQAQAQATEQAQDIEKAVEAKDKEIEDLKAQLEKEKNQYLFLMADFENFRKRVLKEKADMLKYGSESAMRDLLPVVDDFERAIDAMSKGGDVDSLKEGVDLIYSKFVKYLERNKVVPIESTGKDFDDNLHEAITTFPAPDESMRGKVIDTVTKGYMIDDKVLRHAKVVVGQ